MANIYSLGTFKQPKEEGQGAWGYDGRSNSIVRTKTPGKPTIGDLRIKYYISSNELENKKSDFRMTGIKLEGHPDKEKFK